MTKFRMNARYLAMWLHQNAAECIEFAEGCLLDNGLYACKHGMAAIFESYVNSNMSDYTVIFSRNGDKTANKEWDAFTAANPELFAD